ncbi:hypothetical protein N7513_008957 [Penicillium frequentans]|nr:hypothetical protein N7513_008957 [Penicillium glabrum]
MNNAMFDLKHSTLSHDNKRTFQDAFEDLLSETPKLEGDAPVLIRTIVNNIADTSNLDSNSQKMKPSPRSLIPVALLDLVEEERQEWSSERHRQKRKKMEDGHVGQLKHDMLSMPLRPKNSFVAAKPVTAPQLLAGTGTAGLPIRARMTLGDHPLPLLEDLTPLAVSTLSPERTISSLTSDPEVEHFDQDIEIAAPQSVREKYTLKE